MKRLLIFALVAAVGAAVAAPKPKASAKAPAKAVKVAKPIKAVAKPAKTAPAVRAAPAVESPYRRAPYVGAVSVDAKSGAVIVNDGGDCKAYPASVTKLMTALLVLEDVRAGRYSLADAVTATPDVYRCEPSWVGIKPGEKMSVGDLMTALMVESANDAAIALAVNSAGSFEAFVARMNGRAKELGMTGTEYFNPNGLPPNPGKRYPWKSFNYTTAADQAKLALELIRKHPKLLEYTSIKTCDLVKTATGYRTSVTRRVNGGREPAVTQLAPGETLVKALRNHNNVMVKDKLKLINPDGREAVDGLKTGYIDAGGSSMILTGTRNGKRAIVVVLGSARAEMRDENARRLLDDALGAVGW